MTRYYVITWRSPGGTLYFFRGDNRYEIFLPYISAEVVSRGWEKEEARARVFDNFPTFTKSTLAKNFLADRLKVYPYEKALLPTQLLRPIKRPKDPFKS